MTIRGHQRDFDPAPWRNQRRWPKVAIYVRLRRRLVFHDAQLRFFRIAPTGSNLSGFLQPRCADPSAGVRMRHSPDDDQPLTVGAWGCLVLAFLAQIYGVVAWLVSR